MVGEFIAGRDLGTLHNNVIVEADRCLRAAATIFVIFATLNSALAAEQPLTLAEAEALASGNDPGLYALSAAAASLDERAVADGQLPDPTLKAGLVNLPIDSFSLSQEPMTQVVIGVQQAFPRGSTTRLTAGRTRSLAAAERARRVALETQIVRDVRLSWFEALYWSNAQAVVRDSQEAFRNLIEVTEFLYGTGRQNQQDVLRAQLELSLLEDREDDFTRKEMQARAMLATWIGARAMERPLPRTMPILPEPSSMESIEAVLVNHPIIRIEDSAIAASQTGIDLARQAYKPGIRLDLNYGHRRGEDAMGDGRSDFASFMVMVDVPLFTEQRQDRRLSASKHDAAAALHRRDDRLRELRRDLFAEYANWQWLGERIIGYETSVMPSAASNVEAALRAYQNDVTDFASLMRAQITEFDTRLEWLRVRADRSKAQAYLLYLQDGVS